MKEHISTRTSVVRTSRIAFLLSGSIMHGLHLAHFRVLGQDTEAPPQGASFDDQAPDAVPRRGELPAPAAFLVAVDELELAHGDPLALDDLVGGEDGGVRFLRAPHLVD